MRTPNKLLSKTLIGIAVTAAFAPVQAQEADPAALARPESSVRLGAGHHPGYTERDRTIWSQYNGLREGRSHLLLDLDYIKRNDETGVWTIVRGRNLGLETRDGEATLQKQGDWRINLEATASSCITRSARSIPGLSGAGTTNPTIVRLAAPGTRLRSGLRHEAQDVRCLGRQVVRQQFPVRSEFQE